MLAGVLNKPEERIAIAANAQQQIEHLSATEFGRQVERTYEQVIQSVEEQAGVPS